MAEHFLNQARDLCGSVTYRVLHEHVAGIGLSDEFFQTNNIRPNDPVKCNCQWDGGHEPHCDLVKVNELISLRGISK